MAFTREFIRNAAKESGIEIPKELEDTLVQEHLSARDAFAEGKVKTALEENKPEPPQKIKDTPEYKNLKREFDDYKAEIAAKESKAAKEFAARAYYQSKHITGAALDIAMKGSTEEISTLELGEDGKVKDFKALDSLIAGTFKGLVSSTTVKGADTAMPPANRGGGYTDKTQIMAIKDRQERRAAIAQNMNLFEKGD